MLNIVSIVLIVLSVSKYLYCEKIRYEEYRVFRAIPAHYEQMQSLVQLGSREGYSFWIEPGFPERPVDIMVSPDHVGEYESVMQWAGISYSTMINNVQKVIRKQKRFEARAGGSTFNFKRYNNLEEIYSWMSVLDLTHPDVVEGISAGQSSQNRDIKGVRLRFGMQKPAIFIEGGMHAREWISPATAIYLIEQLLNSQDPNVRDLAERYDWYIFPICNPDGYEYTHTTDRLWRKSLSNTGAGPDPEDHKCKGVDLNRNFGFMWDEFASYRVTDPCQDGYAGTEPFSEPETRNLANFVRSLRGKLMAYISFHSYSQLLLIPYSHTNEHLDNYDDAFAIGSTAVAALSGRHNTHYQVGNNPELLHATSGSSVDWAKGTMEIELVYAYELRDEGNFGFLVPPQLMALSLDETVDSLVGMFQEARNLGYPKDKLLGTSVASSSAGRATRDRDEHKSKGKKSKLSFLRCIGG